MKVLLTMSAVLLVGCGTPQGTTIHSGQRDQADRDEEDDDDDDDGDEDDQDEDDDSDTSTSGTSTSDASTSGTSASGTSTSGTSTSDASTSDTSTSDTSGGPGLDCETIDHAQCWADVVAAWDPAGYPYPTEGMVLAYGVCYGNPTIPIEPDMLISACNVDLPIECLGGNYPGCAEAYCDCALGSLHYDWSSCYAITMVACGWTFSGSPECLASLASAGCYAGATTEAIATCYDGIIASYGECSSTSPADWSVCDDTMNTCLGL